MIKPNSLPSQQIEDWKRFIRILLYDNFNPKYDTKLSGKCDLVAEVLIDWIEATRKQELEAVAESARKEAVKKIKYYFETMVFDNTGEDKLVNIMDFRKKQSEYLDALSQPKECECYCHYPIQVLTTSKAATLRKECSHCQPKGEDK